MLLNMVTLKSLGRLRKQMDAEAAISS